MCARLVMLYVARNVCPAVAPADVVFASYTLCIHSHSEVIELTSDLLA
jgi:hypothetical protein